MKLKKLSLGLALALAGGSVLAAPNVANTNQKGSLLIFPRVDVTPHKTTIVRITNDSTDPVEVVCYYMDWNKVKQDLHFPVTKTQPLWFDVATGAPLGVGGFRDMTALRYADGDYNPADADGIRIINNGVTQSSFPNWRGEIKCWASTNAGDNQILHNHLAGTATIFDFNKRVAAEYAAWSLYAHRGTTQKNVGSVPGTLSLEGADGTYDYCPKYLIGQYTPKGNELYLERDRSMWGESTFEKVTYGRTQLSVASCTQDLRQDWKWITTKLEFETWDYNEIKRTGAYECTDSWHEVYLDNGHPGNDYANGGIGGYDVDADDFVSTGGANFNRAGGNAYYRVRGMASTQCDETIRNQLGVVIREQKTENVGLVGVQISNIQFSGIGPQSNAMTAVSLHASGQMKGEILWDPQGAHPSKN